MDLNQDEMENSLNLKTINLPENYGGEQLIIRNRPLNDKQFVVATLGRGPKTVAEIEAEKAAKQESLSEKNTLAKKLMQNIRQHIPGMNKNMDSANEAADYAIKNIKLRFFQLTPIELKQNAVEGKYNIDEYITPESITSAARACGFGADETEVER